MGGSRRIPSDNQRVDASERVEFLRTKYGPELLIDVAWVHDMPSFMRKRPHRLGFHDILLVTHGEGQYSLDGYAHAVKPGTVFFTAPQQLRRWDARDVDGLCLFFLPQFVTDFFNDTGFVNRLAYFNCRAEAGALRLASVEMRQLKKRLSEMMREFASLRPDSTHILRAGLYDILMMLARAHERANPDAAPRSHNLITSTFRALVAERVRQEHGVGTYAARLSVSANHLNALCKRHLGVNAKTVISEELAAEARRALLVSTRTTEEVAELLGFKDASYFARFFKRSTGMSPSAFRKGLSPFDLS